MRDVLHTAVSRAYTSPPCGMEGIVRILDGNEESHVVLMCITIVEEREEHFKTYFRTYLRPRQSRGRFNNIAKRYVARDYSRDSLLYASSTGGMSRPCNRRVCCDL